MESYSEYTKLILMQIPKRRLAYQYSSSYYVPYPIGYDFSFQIHHSAVAFLEESAEKQCHALS
ncbi:hypothetical protein P3X46_019962, partial [Hevea brasiliensis]